MFLPLDVIYEFTDEVDRGGRRGRLPSIDAGAGYPGDDVLTREQLAAMSPTEIARLNWEDVKAALAR